MTSRIYQILQGTPVAATTSAQLLPSGLTGTRGALRCLTHPDTVTFPPLIYYMNPTRIYNFDADVLRHPIAKVTRTLSSSKTVRFEEVPEDVIVTELWDASGGVSMPIFMFRQLYNYLVNPPAFDALNQQYIIWKPRDETDDTYEVEMLGLKTGGGTPGKYNIKKYQSRGGPNDTGGGLRLTPTDTMDVSPTALIDQPVSLTMRIISKIEA